LLIYQNYYNHQCREIKLQKLFDHLLGFQEHTSQIQDFFSTSVQFQDFYGPEKSKLKFQVFSGPAGTLIKAKQLKLLLYLIR